MLGTFLNGLELLEPIFKKYSLVIGFAVIGATIWISYVLSDRLCRRPIHGSAIAILWCRDRMSAYKIPKLFRVVKSPPRNAMGKVAKSAVRDLFSTNVICEKEQLLPTAASNDNQ